MSSSQNYSKKHFNMSEPGQICDCCHKEFITSEHMNADYNSNTGELRGWLCTPCYSTIAENGDDISVYIQMIKQKNKNISKDQIYNMIDKLYSS